MNHDAPRQLSDGSGLWHYTRSSRRAGTYAIGGCSPFRACGTCRGAPAELHDCGECDSSGVVAVAEPCPGHATAEQACEHQRQHLLEGARFSAGSGNPSCLNRCHAPGCRAYTSGTASVGISMHWDLCAEHRNPETLALLAPAVGEAWGS